MSELSKATWQEKDEKGLAAKSCSSQAEMAFIYSVRNAVVKKSIGQGLGFGGVLWLCAVHPDCWAGVMLLTITSSLMP